MIQVELTSDEQEVLSEVLTHELADLRMEIRETDNRDFREGLKHRESLLSQIAEKVRSDE